MALPVRAFVTERLRLVPLDETHEEGLWEMFSDNELIAFVPFELETDRKAHGEKFRKQLEECVRFKFHFGIEWRDPDEAGEDGAIGLGMLRPTEDGKAVEIGYCIVRRHWGKGLASEAARALVDQAAPAMRVKRRDLIARILDGNDASFRIAEKLGFARVKNVTEKGRKLWILRYSG